MDSIFHRVSIRKYKKQPWEFPEVRKSVEEGETTKPKKDY